MKKKIGCQWSDFLQQWEKRLYYEFLFNHFVAFLMAFLLMIYFYFFIIVKQAPFLFFFTPFFLTPILLLLGAIYCFFRVRESLEKQKRLIIREKKLIALDPKRGERIIVTEKQSKDH